MKRYLLACALGFVGSSVALDPGASLFIGLFLSFFAAYLLHTFPAANGIIPRAYPMANQHAWRICPAFAARAFHFIHANARLLFGIDVAIGVAVGHYTGSTLVGGLAGGCWWLFDWHLISVKVMGLKAA